MRQKQDEGNSTICATERGHECSWDTDADVGTADAKKAAESAGPKKA